MKTSAEPSRVSSQTARFPRRTIAFALGLMLLHFTCAYALDAAGLVESLLSPSGAQLVWILPLAVIFYALRITVFFVVPGVFVGSVIVWLVDEMSERYR
jgi:hypothetical protein